jgi:hypothetical protein
MKWIKPQYLFKENFEHWQANEDVKYFNSVFSNLGMELIIKEFSAESIPYNEKSYEFNIRIDLYRSIFKTYFDKLNFSNVISVLHQTATDVLIIALNNKGTEEGILGNDYIRYNLDKKLFTDHDYFLKKIYSSLGAFMSTYKYKHLLYVIGAKLNTDNDMDNSGFIDGSVILNSIIDYINILSNKRENFDMNKFGDIVSKNINEVSMYSLFKDCPFYDSLLKNLSDDDIKGIDDMAEMGF